MRLFCVKMQRCDWFRMGHSDWLWGSGRFVPFRVVWSGSDQVEVTWLGQWWLSCAENRNPAVWVNLFIGNIKWQKNVMVLCFWIKTGLLFLLWQYLGGHTGRALHRECMSGSCCGCFCSNISGGPRVGPNLIAHVSSIYKWCVQWLTWESQCCCFRGMDYLRDLDFWWPVFDFCWNVNLVTF